VWDIPNGVAPQGVRSSSLREVAGRSCSVLPVGQKPEKVRPDIEPIRLYTLGFQEWSHCGLRLRGWIQMHDQMSRVVVRGRGTRSGTRFWLSLDVVGGIPRSKVQA
jgi:hypothetical protein